MQRHVRQQHSNNPSRFSCTICDKAFSCCQKMKLQMETVHAAENLATDVRTAMQRFQDMMTEKPTCDVHMNVDVERKT